MPRHFTNLSSFTGEYLPISKQIQKLVLLQRLLSFKKWSFHLWTFLASLLETFSFQHLSCGIEMNLNIDKRKELLNRNKILLIEKWRIFFISLKYSWQLTSGGKLLYKILVHGNTWTSLFGNLKGNFCFIAMMFVLVFLILLLLIWLRVVKTYRNY